MASLSFLDLARRPRMTDKKKKRKWVKGSDAMAHRGEMRGKPDMKDAPKSKGAVLYDKKKD